MKTQIDGKHQLQQCQLVRQEGHRGKRPRVHSCGHGTTHDTSAGARQQTHRGTVAAADHTPEQAIEDGKDKTSREKIKSNLTLKKANQPLWKGR